MAENLSGIPPQVTLSGLEAGPGGSFSGASQQALGGTGGYGTSPFGLTGGPDLLQLLLQQLQGGGEVAGVGTGGDILQSLTQGSLGQQQGGLGAGSFGQTQPGYVAGQSAAGAGPAQAAQAAGAGSVDPLALAQKLLGLTSKGLGVADRLTSTASPTAGAEGLQATGGEQQAFQTGVASPTNVPQDLQQSGLFQGGFGGMGGLSDPTLGNLFTTGALTGFGGGLNDAIMASLQADPALAQALFSGQIGPDLGAALGAGSGGAGYTLGANTSLTDPTASISGAGAGGGLGFGEAASGLGGLQSLLGLYQSAQTGNPVGLAQSLYGLYQGASGLAGVAPISELIATYAPQVASALVSAAGTGAAAGAGTGAAATAPAVASALSGLGGAAAPIIAAVVAYIGSQEEKAARESGWWNNPIRGALYSGATSGVANAQRLLGGLGDLTQAPTEDLLRAITGGANSLMPYYATAPGGKGPVRASETAGAPGTQTPEEYTQNFYGARTGLAGAVQEALNRGITYEQLGKLPVSGNWALQSLDAGGTPEAFYTMNQAKYASEGQGLLNQAWQASGIDPNSLYVGGNYYGPNQPGSVGDSLLNAALGSSMLAPESATHASGLYTGMYGGPLWAALARMGAPEFTGLISQNFDPWVNLRQMGPQQLYSAMGPYQGGFQQAQREAELANQYWSSIGGG